tara:strand:+ start:62425 stop:62847 length:423 start_codon:yes stop_codon:yes gene_type:complete
VRVQTVNDDIQPASNASKDSEIPQKQEDLIEVSKDEVQYHRFECRSCGYVYDPLEGIKKFAIPKGTSFLDLDKEKFRCPVCREGIDAYVDIGSRMKPSGFDENLSYGFGFNTLPSGQKNVLIFGGLAFAAACFLSLYSLR